MFIIAPVINIITIGIDLDERMFNDIHFGINPVNGGIPLRDSNSMGIIYIIIGVFVSTMFIEFLTFIFLMWKIRNSGLIINVYITKYIIVANGFIVAISAIIHPRCVIDE